MARRFERNSVGAIQQHLGLVSVDLVSKNYASDVSKGCLDLYLLPGASPLEKGVEDVILWQ